MDEIITIMTNVISKNGLVTAFVIVGVTSWISYYLANKVFRGKIHGSAIAIVLGLALAYIGGKVSGGHKGLSDLMMFNGFLLMGGAMLRDLAITSTAFGVQLEKLKTAGIGSILALFISIALSFYIGAGVAWSFGYDDIISMTTIGAGTATFIVGPVVGTGLGASSEVITLSIAAGVIKSISIMILTPLLAKRVGLTTPESAAIYGGLMGSSSGVSAGLAATDPKLVPYGCFVAAFYTGLGCLLAPSILYATLLPFFG